MKGGGGAIRKTCSACMHAEGEREMDAWMDGWSGDESPSSRAADYQASEWREEIEDPGEGAGITATSEAGVAQSSVEGK